MQQAPTLPIDALLPDGLCKLPLFRPVALEMLRLLSKDEVDISELSALLQTDAGFAAEILALANSPLYGAICRIHSLSRAILVLGLERTRAMTLTVALRALIRNVQDTPEIRNSWRHSLACALVSEELGPIFGIARDRAYTAGLMHDVGRLGLLAAYGEPYSKLLTTSYDAPAEILREEQEWFEIDHCQAGAWLARVWGFPEEFWRIAADHHQRQPSRERDIVSLVHTACPVADALDFSAIRYRTPPSFEKILSGLPHALQGRVHFRFEALQTLVREKLDSIDCH